MAEQGFRAGFVAVVGRPNVGKSTLVNALVGSKISIVTPKPQTTRHRVLGILNSDSQQLVFVDTPGLHARARNVMNRSMNRASMASIADADVILLVVEALRLQHEDRAMFERLADIETPVVLAVNKVDQVKDKKALLPFLAEMTGKRDFAAVVPVSALTGEQLDSLLSELGKLLPASPPLYPGDMQTDRGLRFRVAEVIREKLMWRLEKEVPYGVAVEIESLEQADEGLRVAAVIWVERAGQKAIVIGKQGKMLKEAGRAARLELREQLGLPVHIELWVKVRENWSDNERALRQLGHELK